MQVQYLPLPVVRRAAVDCGDGGDTIWMCRARNWGRMLPAMRQRFRYRNKAAKLTDTPAFFNSPHFFSQWFIILATNSGQWRGHFITHMHKKNVSFLTTICCHVFSENPFAFSSLIEEPGPYFSLFHHKNETKLLLFAVLCPWALSTFFPRKDLFH